jgi:hypothetical protein
MPVGLRDAEGEERKQFFFEKNNQKTFYYKRLALPQRAHKDAKVFASFFKKKRFSASDESVSTAPRRMNTQIYRTGVTARIGNVA